MSDGGDPDQRPTGAPGGSYSGIPSDGDFDELTRKAGGLRSRRSMLGLAGAAIVAGIVAWFVWGRGGSRCTTASSCGDRHYCDEDETCICTETAEGDIKCGQLPPYCEVPLCTTSADCEHLGEGFFCDTPNSGCCNDGHLSRCIAPCGAEYPPPPTTTTTSTTVPPEDEEEPDEEEPVDDGEPAHLRRTATQPDGVLFFTRREDGTAAYFYGQEGSDGGLQPTHVVFEDEDGALATVIVNDEMLPVNWTASTLSMAARAESRDTVLDPSDALHSIIVESEEWTLRANLVPKDLAGAVAAAEELTEERFADARDVVADTAGWTALVEAAQEAGDDQPQHIANALGLSIAHAVAVIMAAAEEIEIESEEGSGSEDDEEDGAAAATDRALPISAPTAILPIYKWLSDLLGPLLESMVKNALLNLAAEPLAPTAPTDPTVPTFDLLLCQGATSWGTVCHYTFFDRENIMGCLDFCKTDLSCFNNICAPITLAVEDVMQTW